MCVLDGRGGPLLLKIGSPEPLFVIFKRDISIRTLRPPPAPPQPTLEVIPFDETCLLSDVGSKRKNPVTSSPRDVFFCIVMWLFGMWDERTQSVGREDKRKTLLSGLVVQLCYIGEQRRHRQVTSKMSFILTLVLGFVRVVCVYVVSWRETGMSLEGVTHQEVWNRKDANIYTLLLGEISKLWWFCGNKCTGFKSGAGGGGYHSTWTQQ